MREKSQKKVQQVLDFMKLLHIRVEARQRVDTKTGFIDTVVFWSDDEDYKPVLEISPIPTSDEKPEEETAEVAPEATEVTPETPEVTPENV